MAPPLQIARRRSGYAALPASRRFCMGRVKSGEGYYRTLATAIALIVLGIRGADPAAAGIVSFDLTFPSGYGLSRVSVAANGTLTLGPGDQIEGLDGSPGDVTNAGDGALVVRPGTRAGNLVSIGSIELDPTVAVTSARSAGTVSVSPGVSVGVVEQGIPLTP